MSTFDTDTPIRHLRIKAMLLMALIFLLMCAAAAYVLYARGAFERTQELILLADDSEGVSAGMDLTFSGFPIGRVRKVELSDQGTVRITIDVPLKDAKWLRTSSVFTFESALVGGAKLRAFSGVLTDPPLEDGAERTVLRGDATSEIPRLVATLRELATNLADMTASGGALRTSLDNVQTATTHLNGDRGAMRVLLGTDAKADQIMASIARTNALLAQLDKVTQTANAQFFGNPTQAGLTQKAQKSIEELTALLSQTRTSMQQVDKILQDATAISGNAKTASEDLGALRSDLEATLSKVDGLVTDLNRRWPFSRETEVKLP